MKIKLLVGFILVMLTMVTFAQTQEWAQTKVYNSGDTISYDGSIYKANWWNQNANPSQNYEKQGGYGQPWTLISSIVSTPTPTPQLIPLSSLGGGIQLSGGQNECTISLKNNTNSQVVSWFGTINLGNVSVTSVTGCSYSVLQNGDLSLSSLPNDGAIAPNSSTSITINLNVPDNINVIMIFGSIFGISSESYSLPPNNEKILIIAGNPHDYVHPSPYNSNSKGQEEAEITSSIYNDALANGFLKSDIIYLFGIGQYSKAASEYLSQDLQSVILPATVNNITYYMQSKNLEGIYFIADGLPAGVELENDSYFMYNNLENINFNNSVVFVSNSCTAFNYPYGTSIINDNPKFFMAGITTLNDVSTYNIDLSKNVFESIVFKNQPISSIESFFTQNNPNSGIWGIYADNNDFHLPTPSISSITSGIGPSGTYQAISWNINTSNIDNHPTNIGVRYSNGMMNVNNFSSSIINVLSFIINTYMGSVEMSDNWVVVPISDEQMAGTIKISTPYLSNGEVMEYQLFTLNSVTASTPLTVKATYNNGNIAFETITGNE